MSAKNLIMDTGTYELKYGYGTEAVPKVEPSLVGKAAKKQQQSINCLKRKAKITKVQLIGLEAQDHEDCTAKSPIVNRKIVDWDRLEKLWDYVIKTRLDIKAEDHYNVFLSVPVLTSSEDQFKCMQIMFEKFGFDGIYIGDAATLALLAAGEKTGVVIDSGEELTQVVPIQDGEPIVPNMMTLNIGGQDITNHLSQMLFAKNGGKGPDKSRPMTGQALSYVKRLKEKFGSVAQDYGQSLITQKPSDCIELMKCTEPLFEPAFLKKVTGIGLSEMVFEVIGKCDLDLQERLYGNIVLAGGNSNLKGMEDRIRKDLLEFQVSEPKIVPKFSKLPVEDRSYAAWKGAAMMAQSSWLTEFIITRKAYDEYGKKVLSKNK